jgi:hypothetical protein
MLAARQRQKSPIDDITYHRSFNGTQQYGSAANGKCHTDSRHDSCIARDSPQLESLVNQGWQV